MLEKKYPLSISVPKITTLFLSMKKYYIIFDQKGNSYLSFQKSFD